MLDMALQKGLNKNRNHHDDLSQSGKGYARYNVHGTSVSSLSGPIHSGKKNEYGQGKHSKGGKTKQKHW